MDYSTWSRARRRGACAWRTVIYNFKIKTECISLYVSGLSFTHKEINSEINSITSVYYIES
jgi:hypothetical protein